MLPDTDDPDYLPSDALEWAREHRELLDIVVEELLTDGYWPEIGPLTRRLARESRPVAVSTVMRQMPRPLGFVENHPERVVLLLFGLRLTHPGQKLIAGFTAILRLARERYSSDSETAIISRSDAASGIGVSDAYVEALSEVLLREVPFLASGNGSAEEHWTREVTDDIVRYWDARTADDYLRIRADELRSSPQLGWSRPYSEAPVSNDESRPAESDGSRRDLFISYAGEDRESAARPLANRLTELGFSVWFDESELVVGDSLSESINWGLAHSDFGVVILSKQFFDKPWPRAELGGLIARQMADGKRGILPVWHGIDHRFLVQHAPLLADLLAARMDQGVKQVADEVSRAIRAPQRPVVGDAVQEVDRTRRETRGSFAHTELVDEPIPTERELLDVAPTPPGAPDHWMVYDGMLLLRFVARAVPSQVEGPKGRQAGELLDQATAAATTHAQLAWRPAANGLLLQRLGRGWRTAKPRHWEAGMSSDDPEHLAGRPTAAAAVSTKPLVITIDRTHATTVPTSDGGRYFAAHDPEVAADTATACIFTGTFLSGTDGVAKIDVLVQLAGAPSGNTLVSSEAYSGSDAPFGEPHEGIGLRPPFAPTHYLGLTRSDPEEMVGQPEVVAARLLDDWLVTFRSGDVFAEIRSS